MKQLYAEFKAEITVPHRADYQVLWFQKGTSVHYVDFKPIVLQPNTSILVNK
jgi:hypothetical protein